MFTEHTQGYEVKRIPSLGFLQIEETRFILAFPSISVSIALYAKPKEKDR